MLPLAERITSAPLTVLTSSALLRLAMWISRPSALSVTVTAGGNIGSPDNYLSVRSGGAIHIVSDSSTYGLVFFRRAADVPSTLYDDPNATGYYMLDADGNPQRFDRPGTGLQVIGYFTADAYLWVGTHAQTARTEGADKHTIRIRIRDGAAVLFDYDIRIDIIIGYILDPATGGKLPLIALDHTGKNAGVRMLLRLFVGEAYNGRTFLVSYTIDGRTYERQYTVAGGYLSFYLQNTACEIEVTLESAAKDGARAA